MWPFSNSASEVAIENNVSTHEVLGYGIDVMMIIIVIIVFIIWRWRRNGDLETFDAYITANLSVTTNTPVPLDVAICYLHAVTEVTGARLEQAWSSFGINLTNETHDVTIASLYRFDPVGDPVTITGGTGQGDRLFNLFMLFAPCRLHSGLRPEYRPVLATRYANVMADILKPLAPAAWALKCPGWDQQPAYAALAAAYDMFLFKTETHEYAKVLRTAIRADDMLGASYWIWNGRLADEFEKIFKDGEELDKADSYTPYYAGFKLGTRSPYSATMSPQLHYFVHTIGCLSNSKRSINARAIAEVGIKDARDNALIVGYVIAGRRRHVAQFYRPSGVELWRVPELRPRVDCLPGAEAAGGPGDQEDDLGSVSSASSITSRVVRDFGEDPNLPEPVTKHASDWYQYMVANNSIMPRRMRISVLNILAALDKTRPDTIGDHLKTWARAELRTIQQM
ncbi:hypothetical protein quinque_007929 [Culex quinquefasciatus]